MCQIILNQNDFENGQLKFSSYPKVLSTLAYHHLKNTDQGINVLIQDQYAWAIISLKLTFNEPIKESDLLQGKTWYSGQKGPYYRREFIINYGDSQIVGATYSILLDVKTRLVYRHKKLPFNLMSENLTHVINLNTNYHKNITYKKLGEKIIDDTHIDNLGHVNHLNYVIFIEELLTEKIKKEVQKYNTMELFYHKELLIKDVCSINYAVLENEMIFTIFNNSKQQKSFTLILSNE